MPIIREKRRWPQSLTVSLMMPIKGWQCAYYLFCIAADDPNKILNGVISEGKVIHLLERQCNLLWFAHVLESASDAMKFARCQKSHCLVSIINARCLTDSKKIRVASSVKIYFQGVGAGRKAYSSN